MFEMLYQLLVDLILSNILESSLASKLLKLKRPTNLMKAKLIIIQIGFMSY